MNQFPRRTAAPAVEPVTLAEALVHLRADADGSTNDAYIGTLITAAREACEARTERSLIASPWLLQLPAWPSDGIINLRIARLIAVTSVQYLDADGSLQTLASDQYQADPASEPGRVISAPGVTWPATQSGAWNAVRVAFTAGYGATAADVPAKLKQWILLAVQHMYDERGWDVPDDFAPGLINSERLLGV